jgi:3-phenylpropionate/trans-cinnamate dioxygenase ferredoxin reductase subunit
LKLQIAGLARGSDETVVRGDLEAHCFAVFHLRAGRLIAVEAVNSPRDFMACRKLIAAGFATSPGALLDPDTDLGALAKQAEAEAAG